MVCPLQELAEEHGPKERRDVGVLVLVVSGGAADDELLARDAPLDDWSLWRQLGI